jgi:signal transduction histidine kinase
MQEFQDRQETVSRLANALADSGSPFSARLRRCLSIVREELGAAEAILHLFPAERDEYTLREESSCPEHGAAESPLWEGAAERVLSSGEPLRVDSTRGDSGLGSPGSGDEGGDHALLAAPLHSDRGEAPFGALIASAPEAFTAVDLDRLVLVGQWIAPFLGDHFRTPDYPPELSQGTDRLEEGRAGYSSNKPRLEELELVIHDLKSPLAALMTNLDLLHGISSTEKQASLARTALTSAGKLYQRITQFLDLSRLEALNSGNPSLHPVNLEGAVAMELREHQTMLENKRLTISTNGPDETVVLAEESLLHHLLQNLLSNAIRHTPSGGSISLTWSMHGAMRSKDPSATVATVCLEDTGEGIPEQKRRELMRSIQMGPRSYLGERGSGLGLIICSRILDILQGSLWIEEAPSGGARVCFTLPGPEEATGRAQAEGGLDSGHS